MLNTVRTFLRRSEEVKKLPNSLSINHCAVIPTDFGEYIAIIQMNLSVILRVFFNSSQEVETEKMDVLCKQTYELILTAFPCSSITPSLQNFWLIPQN